MIAFINGKLDCVTEHTVEIEANGVGYEVFVPSSVNRYLPLVGGQIKLYTYHQVKEDGMALYGFINREDLEVFKLLITVSGIGPKGALAILSVLSVSDLMYAIASGDAKAISRAPGVGGKTAAKLIVELKDKFKIPGTVDSGQWAVGSGQSPTQGDNSIISEVVLALESLGFSPTQSFIAAKQSGYTEGMTSEELLKKALGKIADS